MASWSNDESFIRMAIQLALDARKQGEDPFGALLVRDGQVVAQSTDQSIRLSDPTGHAELVLISSYCRAHGIISLDGYTLYTSTEPCVMCAGALHWSRVSKVVFSVSQERLQRSSSGRPKPDCRSILNSGHRQVEVVGPLLEDEGLTAYDGYVFIPKSQRLSGIATTTVDPYGGGARRCPMSAFRYNIRPAERTDVDQLVRLSKLWEGEGCTRVYPAFGQGSDRPEKWFANGYIWIAEIDAMVVGFVAGVVTVGHGHHFRSDGEQFFNIHEAYVESGHRGRGVGGRLVEAILGNAKSDGIQKSLVASGNIDWESTYRFYERHRFQMLSMQMYL